MWSKDGRPGQCCIVVGIVIFSASVCVQMVLVLPLGPILSGFFDLESKIIPFIPNNKHCSFNSAKCSESKFHLNVGFGSIHRWHYRIFWINQVSRATSLEQMCKVSLGWHERACKWLSAFNTRRARCFITSSDILESIFQYIGIYLSILIQDFVSNIVQCAHLYSKAWIRSHFKFIFVSAPSSDFKSES